MNYADLVPGDVVNLDDEFQRDDGSWKRDADCINPFTDGVLTADHPRYRRPVKNGAGQENPVTQPAPGAPFTEGRNTPQKQLSDRYLWRYIVSGPDLDVRP